MKILYFIKQNKFFFALLALLLAGLLFLTALFPYSGDDWAWGSSLGTDRLENGFFDGYNGRYLGNLLVLIITRSKVLRSIAISFSLFALCLLPSAIAGKKRISLVALSTLLLLLMPKTIFTQSVVWASGFSNYVPPAVLLGVYFLLCNGLFKDDSPIYTKKQCVGYSIASFLLAFSGALFIENVTLCNIITAVAVIFYSAIRFKKVFAFNISFAIGTVAGAVCMFSNSVYSSIASGEDGYRDVATSETLKETLISHTDTILSEFFIGGIIVFAILTVLLTTLTLRVARKSAGKTQLLTSYISLGVNIASLVIFVFKKNYSDWNPFFDKGNASTLFFAFIMLLYCFSTLLNLISNIGNVGAVCKIMLPLFNVPVLIIPLLIVNPIGPRCFFAPYFMLVLTVVLIADYLLENVSVSEETEKRFTAGILICSAICLIFYLNIFITVDKYSDLREEYLYKQVEEGKTTITLPSLPYSSYIHVPNPTGSKTATWNKRFKMFYGVDENLEIKLLSPEKFDEWRGSPWETDKKTD